jgi:hypothetical protein
VATVAGLEARARGGKDPALILAACDQGMMVRTSGRRRNPSTEDRRRDGPRSQPAGTGSDALVPEGKGGEIASSVPAEARVQTGRGGTWIATSVPAEARVQTGRGGTWIATSVPAQIRARAQSAYEQAYTRAYRAYLGASPAAGDPTATPLSGAATCVGPLTFCAPSDLGIGDGEQNCGPWSDGCTAGCSCTVFFYVVYSPDRTWFSRHNCSCSPQGSGCKCTVEEKHQHLVPIQRSRKMCASSVRHEDVYLPREIEASCADCSTLNPYPGQGCECDPPCEPNDWRACCTGGAASCGPYCSSDQIQTSCDWGPLRGIPFTVSKGTLCATPVCR